MPTLSERLTKLDAKKMDEQNGAETKRKEAIEKTVLAMLNDDSVFEAFENEIVGRRPRLDLSNFRDLFGLGLLESQEHAEEFLAAFNGNRVQARVTCLHSHSVYPTAHVGWYSDTRDYVHHEFYILLSRGE